jgi:hypothetical protein
MNNNNFSGTCQAIEVGWNKKARIDLCTVK